jgi:hypothetical protein
MREAYLVAHCKVYHGLVHGGVERRPEAPQHRDLLILCVEPIVQCQQGVKLGLSAVLEHHTVPGDRRARLIFLRIRSSHTIVQGQG